MRIKIFIKSFFVCLGAISAVFTIVGLIWATKISTFMSEYEYSQYCLSSVVFIVSFLYAIVHIWEKDKLSLNITKKLRTNIYYGDLFKVSGIIVIPVNEYFDTIVDDKIISSNTLHGKFIKSFFKNNESELKEQISKSLSKITPLSTNMNRGQGNRKRYPLGTVAIVEQEEKTFFLLALTRFNDNHRAELTKSEYQRVIMDLFDFMEQHSQGFKINLPLIGSGHSSVELSEQKLLEFLLFSMTLNDKLTLLNGIDIILYKDVKDKIDLNKIDYYYSITEE